MLLTGTILNYDVEFWIVCQYNLVTNTHSKTHLYIFPFKLYLPQTYDTPPLNVNHITFRRTSNTPVKLQSPSSPGHSSGAQVRSSFSPAIQSGDAVQLLFLRDRIKYITVNATCSQWVNPTCQGKRLVFFCCFEQNWDGTFHLSPITLLFSP